MAAALLIPVGYNFLFTLPEPYTGPFFSRTMGGPMQHQPDYDDYL